MTGLDRYVFRQLGFALIAVTGGLALLIWLTQSLRFVELVVNRGLSFAIFIQLTSLMIPRFVAVILPITTFVVVLFIYQRLASDRELVVMRAAGISNAGMARPVLVLASCVVGLGFLLQIYIVPWSYGAFREFQFELRNRMAAILLQDGVFTPVTDDLTVYVRKRNQDGTLHGLLIHDARVRDNPATILAESGAITTTPAGPRITLLNGSRQQMDRTTGRLNVLSFAANSLDLAQGRRLEETRYRDSQERSISELLHPDPNERINPRDLPKWRAEAHQRMSGPLSTFSYAMLALTVILTGGFRRHGGSGRLLVGILGLVSLLALGLAINNIAARQNVAIPLIWAHAILPGLVCTWILFRPTAKGHPPAAATRTEAAT